MLAWYCRDLLLDFRFFANRRPPDTERAAFETRLAPADEKLLMRIVLGSADGLSGKVIAARLHTSAQTVSKWRRRYENPTALRA